MSDLPTKPSCVLPYAAPTAERMGVLSRAMLVIAWMYPLLPLAALYLTWAVAWAVLGHMPRPSLDEPKSISTVVHIPYVITALLLMSIPVAMLTGMIVGVVLTLRWINIRQQSSKRPGLITFAFFALYGGAFALLQLDPFGVLYWYMD